MDYLLNDENEDEILAQVQEESLRHYKEVELPRIQSESLTAVDSTGNETSREANETNPKGPNRTAKSSESNGSVLCTQLGGKAGTLLFDGEEAKGFHLAAGTSYIYPTNFPIRQYQAAIVRSALFKNTLVSLPTGLGKTFIAAVVMYNFYRWFPCGKVVFMAPTRPLVAQQIKACYSIMGIPSDDTTEMTGTQAADIREKMWKEKRVFFLTPQVMANDLLAKTCPADLIKCLVVDEAHKAVKDYAYCQVVKALSAASVVYRTLALSATPGNDINAVIQVIRNLNICCLEMRGEDSIDVAPYTHGKSVEQVVVDLSPELVRVKDDFMQVYERFARSLIDNRALTSNIAFLTKFQILKAMEKFRANPPRGMSATLIGSLVSDFTMCMTFAHALELLQIYGLRAFYRYLADDCGEKSKAASTRLRNNSDLQTMLKKLHGILYPNPGSDVPYTWGHPKLKKLVTSLSDHFKAANEKGEKTKAIVFCNYKIVVNEIVDLLGQSKSHIKAALFVGQSGGKERGMPQAKQLQIMKDFRDGKINCLVATCVAEEGLDIGEVDLIVLMESQKSPVRLVQRLGRTGRKRRGRCIVLLTRGKEEHKFHEAMASRKSYVKNIVESKAVKNSLCQYSPPMFPPAIKPQQQLVHIKVTTAPTPTKPVKQTKKQMDIRECAVHEKPPFLDEESAERLIEELGGTSLDFNRLPTKMELWHRKSGPKMSADELFASVTDNSLASWNDWNTELHTSYVISCTASSNLYCHLMSYKPEEENQEYLKLVEDGEVGSVLALGEANPGNSEKVANQVEYEKPAKKKNVPKKNFGMDIRSCMAVAVERATKKPRIDLIDDDVILVDDNDDVVCGGCEGGLADIAAEIRCSRVSNIVEKPSAGKPFAHIEDEGAGNQLDIAALFGMNGDDFQDLLYGGELLCGLENDIDLCYRLGKFLGDPKYAAPKPKCMDENVFKLQCDQFLGLMDGVRDIAFRTVVELEPDSNLKAFESLKITGTSCTTGSTISREPQVPSEHRINRAESPEIHQPRNSQPETETNNSNESFVGIDDLFGDEDLNGPDMEVVGNRIAISPVKSPPSNKLTGFDNIGEISPIVVKKNYTTSSLWGSNSLFAGPLTPLGKGTNNSKAIVSSTPINPNQRKRELFGAAEKQADEKDEWLLDDILEEEEMSKDDDKTKPENDHHNSSRDLFSSPPARKVFEVVCTEPIKQPAPKSAVQDDFEEDFWCMDDLFDDDKAEMPNNTESKDETTHYGITQMVSQIEREKKKNQKAIDEDVIEILDSPSCSPIRNVCEGDEPVAAVSFNKETAYQDLCQNPSKPLLTADSQKQKIRANPDMSDLNRAVISTHETALQPTTQPLTKENPGLKSLANQPDASCTLEKSVIGTLDFSNSDKNVDVFIGPLISTKAQEDSVPICVIDSDSNGSSKNDPKPSTSKELGETPSKVAVGDTNCHLLDEDDDIFSSLALGGYSTENRTGQSGKSTVNFKKFKKRNSTLLSHLNSEPDNDFPPEKRNNYNPEETMHLKVGSVSKRKLSFEDMLKELDESTTSKYFDSSEATVKDSNGSKPCVGTVGKPLKLPIGSKRVAVVLDEDEDIFIGPAQKKSIEHDPSRNESKSSTESSHSRSPVDKIRKKKKKKKTGHAFIEREAEESGLLSSDDSDNSSLDQMDDSFVDDESDHELSYAHYLKSVKSPAGGGKFKIPVNNRYIGNVYSQVVNTAGEDYENDSFCVDSNEEHSGDETTILELAERKLAKRKTDKKRILDLGSEDTDDEDETCVEDSKSSVVTPICVNKKKRRLLESDSDHTPERVPVKRPRKRFVSPNEDETFRNISMEGNVQREPLLKTTPADIPQRSIVKTPPVVRIDSDSDEELKEAIRLSVLETKTKSPEELQYEEDLQKALILSQHEVKGGWSGWNSARRNVILESSGNPGPSGLHCNPGPSGLHSDPGLSEHHSNPGPSGHHGNHAPDRALSNFARQTSGSSARQTSGSSARQTSGSSAGMHKLPPSFTNEGGTSFLFMSQPLLKDRPLSTKPKVSKTSAQNSKPSNRVFELSDDSN